MQAQREVLTAEELKTKGISIKDVQGMIRRLETRIGKHLARHLAGLGSEKEQREWDLACAHHDHAVKTLHVLWATR